MNTNNIVIYNDGIIYKIDKEHFETNQDVYKRGWYIIKTYNRKEIKNKIYETIIEIQKKIKMNNIN